MFTTFATGGAHGAIDYAKNNKKIAIVTTSTVFMTHLKEQVLSVMLLYILKLALRI